MNATEFLQHPFTIFLLSGLFAWATWVTIKVAGALSRDDHNKICTERQEIMSRKMGTLHEKMDTNLKILNEIATHVAVLDERTKK